MKELINKFINRHYPFHKNPNEITNELKIIFGNNQVLYEVLSERKEIWSSEFNRKRDKWKSKIIYK